MEPSICCINRTRVENFSKYLISLILPETFTSHFCLAGGCFKTLIHNKHPNDIDLWPVSESDRIKLIVELVYQGGKIVSEGEFNTVIRQPSFNDLTACPKIETMDRCLKIEVTKKCPSSLEVCLAEFDLVLSCIGVEFHAGRIVKSHIHSDVERDVANREVNLVKILKLHKYNLLSLKRLHRYANELEFSVPSTTIDYLWRVAFMGASEREINDLLQAANIELIDIPPQFRFNDG